MRAVDDRIAQVHPGIEMHFPVSTLIPDALVMEDHNISFGLVANWA